MTQNLFGVVEFEKGIVLNTKKTSWMRTTNIPGQYQNTEKASQLLTIYEKSKKIEKCGDDDNNCSIHRWQT